MQRQPRVLKAACDLVERGVCAVEFVNFCNLGADYAIIVCSVVDALDYGVQSVVSFFYFEAEWSTVEIDFNFRSLKERVVYFRCFSHSCLP